MLHFYSQLMATNVLSADIDREARSLRARADELSLDEIAAMLTFGWRVQRICRRALR